MPKFIDLTGKKFGRWTVTGRGEDTAYKHPRFWCLCDCGATKLVKAQSLRNGQSKSCGCWNIEVHRQVCIKRNTTHGMSKTRVFDTWVNMRTRCNNPKSTGYHKYGAKGIKVCERWESFENFLADMGQPPTPKHTIDRIDSREGYRPENCRWATMKEQQNNRLNNRKIIIDGVTMNLQQWAEKLKISRKTLAKLLD